MSLPPDAAPYQSTAIFTQDTIPKGLLKAHTTKVMTWGLIHVVEGRLASRPSKSQRGSSRRAPGRLWATASMVQPKNPRLFGKVAARLPHRQLPLINAQAP